MMLRFFFYAFCFVLIFAEKSPENSSVTPEITSLTTTTYPPMNCPSEWFLYKPTSSCYLQTPQMSWYEAEKYCVEQGGHLASIHSQNELDFINDLPKRWGWIGLNKSNNNGTWKWTDGSATNFMPWNNDNDMRDMRRESSNCTVVGSNGFYDFWICEYDELFGICKKPSTQ